MTVTIPDTQINDTHNINELTSVDGNGVFDLMLNAVRNALREEFEAGRIRGTDYANAYIEAINHVLNQAGQYALAKAKLPLELQHLEAQTLKVATDTAVATKQGALIDAQTQKEMVEAQRVKYEYEVKLPTELDLAQKEYALKEKQVEKELLLKEKQILLAEKDLELKAQQLILGEKEILLKEKQIPLMEKEIELKQNQIDLGIKELSIKEQQLEVAKKEVGIKEQQLALAKFELEVKAPAEVRSTNAQADLYGQKVITEKAQTDNSVVNPNSVIDINNNLVKEQTKGFPRDAQQKLAKLLIDTWILRRQLDPDSNPVNEINKLQDINIGKIVELMGRDLNINF